MRNQYTHNLSLMLEELSRRDDSPFTRGLQVVLYQTLADKLWTPFKAACFNPVVTLAVVVVVYLVFCIIYAPLWLASFLITTYGSWLLFLVFINYLANLISRAIAFAGSNVSVQKQISSDFYRRMAIFLESMAVTISDFTAILLLGASGQMPFSQIPAMDAKFEEIMSRMAAVPVMAQFLRESLNFLTTQLMVTPEEYNIMNKLCGAIEEQVAALTALEPYAVGYITSLESSRRANARSGNAPQHGVPRGSQEFFKVASHCLKVSKALKVAVEVSRPAPASEEDAGMFAKLKSVLSMGTGLEGCEKLTFPYMRCQLEQRFKVEKFSLVGCDKNKIDGAIFPVSVLTNASNSSSTTSPDGIATPRFSPKGLVLFCGPNAGFYEGMCQSDFAASWLGTYLRMGYDVCMFNYRGYGLSTGNANPHSIKQDATQVYTHLQRTRRPGKIILHGESIGGMVASHLARTVPVDCLVCDRTFATLDATAARLMGSWAGLGLKYCTLWSTNVMRDYLAATCPKIILQDPDDEIIANLASLKNGIAMRLVLGDLSWKMVPEPWEYGYAQFLGEELPHKDLESKMIEEAGDVTKRLSEAFVAHFHACLAEVARKASQPKAARRRPRSALAPVASTPRRTVTHRPGGTTGSEDKNRRGNISASGAAAQGGAGSSSNLDAQSGTLEDGYSSHGSRSRHESKDFPFSDAEGDSGDEGSQKGLINDAIGLTSSSNDVWRDVDGESDQGDEDSAQQGQGQHSQQGQGGALSKKEWLEQFCATPLRDPAPGSAAATTSGMTPSGRHVAPAMVSPQLKAWAAVGRVNGGSGQLLGQALRGGIEGVRAWLCALLVWTPQAAADTSLPAGCTSVSGAIKDLNLLIEELHPAEFSQDRAVLFLRNSLLCLDKRLDAQVFHKPPLTLMLRGAASYHQQSGTDTASDATTSAFDRFGCCGSDARMEGGLETIAPTTPAATTSTSSTPSAEATGLHRRHPSPVPSSASAGRSGGFADAALSKITSQAGRCLDVTRSYLSSNPYASIDLCSDLDCTGRHVDTAHVAAEGNSHNTNLNPTTGTYQIHNCACDISSAQEYMCLNSQSSGSAQHMPYVGSIIPLHCGHNGWPAATALASLNDFFVANALA